MWNGKHWLFAASGTYCWLGETLMWWLCFKTWVFRILGFCLFYDLLEKGKTEEEETDLWLLGGSRGSSLQKAWGNLGHGVVVVGGGGDQCPTSWLWWLLYNRVYKTSGLYLVKVNFTACKLYLNKPDRNQKWKRKHCLETYTEIFTDKI